jgi:hypothetical protein
MERIALQQNATAQRTGVKWDFDALHHKIGGALQKI